MSDDLVARLREGCVLLPKRWSGDTGSDRPYGLLDEEETDGLMRAAADRIEELVAERDAWKARADGLLAELARVLHDTGQEEVQKPVPTTWNEAMHDPEIRRVFEEELLVGEAIATVAALVDALGLSQKELAQRLGVSAGRVSRILSGEENLTLRSLGALGWALGVRFDLQPSAMADRHGTPALDDPPVPAWLDPEDGER